jgi:hypothetical protein
MISYYQLVTVKLLFRVFFFLFYLFLLFYFILSFSPFPANEDPAEFHPPLKFHTILIARGLLL